MLMKYNELADHKLVMLNKALDQMSHNEYDKSY